MTRKTARERIESLVRVPADFPFDGYIVEIRPGFVSMKMIGTNRIKRNVAIPDHISEKTLTKGMPARILDHQNQPVLVEVFKNFSELPNYAGKGSVIPNPPRPSVVAGPNGWELSWPAVEGADKYQVYRNDAPNPNSPDDLGIVFGLTLLIPYELNYKWFAVRAISGLQESELSAWVTDSEPPSTPNTFSAEDAFLAHRLVVSSTDVSLNHYGFKYWEVEVADSALGQNNTSLGFMGLADFPKIIDKAAGETNWYRIRAIDYADNASPWTEWDQATALAISVGEGDEIEDRFDGYGGVNFSDLDNLYWLQFANGMEPVSTLVPVDYYNDTYWYANTLSSLTVEDGVYGNNSVRGQQTNPSVEPSIIDGPNFGVQRGDSSPFPLDNESRFTDDDFFIFYLYCSQKFITESQDIDHPEIDNKFIVQLSTVSNRAFVELDIGTEVIAGVNKISIKKSDFDFDSPGFDWDQVYDIHFSSTYAILTYDPDIYVIVDDVRFCKADPTNPDTWNDTGGVWQFVGSNELEAGIWHVYPGAISGEPNKPYSLGQIDDTGAGKHLLAWRDGNIDTGTVQGGVYFKGKWGSGGISFFVNGTTPGNWTFYGVRADTAGTVSLEKWVNGVQTTLSSVPFSVSRDQIIWLGVDLREYSSDSGRIKVYATLQEGNIVQAANLVISLQDTSIAAGGGVGFMTRDKNTRFVNMIAGSPAHAVVSDVAMSLDGPIISGGKRVRFNPLTEWFEISEDGISWTNLVPPA